MRFLPSTVVRSEGGAASSAPTADLNCPPAELFRFLGGCFYCVGQNLMQLQERSDRGKTVLFDASLRHSLLFQIQAASKGSHKEGAQTLSG